LKIGPGGKSRNMAQMIATLIGPGKVAMVSKTSRDQYNLWRVPVDALQETGVNTDFIKILPFSETNKWPCVALIAVDKNGAPQISVVPGITEDFLPTDISAAEPLFATAKKNLGLLVLSLELPLATAAASISQANRLGLPVMLDPGGMLKNTNYQSLFKEPLFLIKPNQHEAQMLTGIKVQSQTDALNAAHVFLKRGVLNVLITLGKEGAVLVNKDGYTNIAIPQVEAGASKDQTGCGDQTMAAFCAGWASGQSLVEAAKSAVIAGTLQFHKPGIVPITAKELAAATAKAT
jgi:ribokinase